MARTSLAPIRHINPNTDPPQADLHLGGAVEVDQAVNAAQAEQKQWMTITTFDDDAQALATGTRYGLGAYPHTHDLDRAHAFAERLEAGYVNVTGFAAMAPISPFGGYTQSGFGPTGGWAGMEEYLQTKNVSVARGAGT